MKIGDKVVIRGIECYVVPETNPRDAPDDARYRKCYGCIFYEHSCHGIRCNDFKFIDLPAFIAAKLTGEIQ